MILNLGYLCPSTSTSGVMVSTDVPDDVFVIDGDTDNAACLKLTPTLWLREQVPDVTIPQSILKLTRRHRHPRRPLPLR